MLKSHHSSLLVYKNQMCDVTACGLQVIKLHEIDTFWTNQLEMHFTSLSANINQRQSLIFNSQDAGPAWFVIFLQSLSVACPSKWRMCMLMNLASYNLRKHFSFFAYIHIARAIYKLPLELIIHLPKSLCSKIDFIDELLKIK